MKAIIRTPANLHYAVDMVSAIKPDEARPKVVTVEDYSDKRTSEQNAMYWASLNEMAAQHGRGIPAEAYHKWCKGRVLGMQEYEIGGDVVFVESSTTRLSKVAFSDYYEQAMALLTGELGIG